MPVAGFDCGVELALARSAGPIGGVDGTEFDDMVALCAVLAARSVLAPFPRLSAEKRGDWERGDVRVGSAADMARQEWRRMKNGQVAGPVSIGPARRRKAERKSVCKLFDRGWFATAGTSKPVRQCSRAMETSGAVVVVGAFGWPIRNGKPRQGATF